MDEQLQSLCNHIKAFYQEPEMKLYEFVKTYGISQAEEGLFMGLCLMNLPAIAVKTISEVYEKDFWELWGDVRDAVYGTRRTFPMQPADDPARPIPTAKFLGRCGDDMIYFWQEGGDIHFSDELEGWFSDLKKRYDEIMEEPFSVENPIRWILELMGYAQEEYYHIFAFTEFFEESFAHLSDRNYLALWKLYEEMLYDPNMEEAGKVIFAPDAPKYEKKEHHYLSHFEPRRQLLRTWCFMGSEKRENLARVTLRRYMALVANVELRKKVFGF
ncbi:MAG: hypothetical protein LUI13_15025 [Lachnospiraceae bacterium]|nr:hypothetical protein [Lachnospiraceae bacterium]